MRYFPLPDFIIDALNDYGPYAPWWNFGQAPQKAYPICNFLFIAMLSSHVCSHVYVHRLHPYILLLLLLLLAKMHIIITYHHYISSLHIIITYQHYISSLHIITYHHYISSLHIYDIYIYTHTWQLSICRSPRSQVFLWPHVASDTAQLPTALARYKPRYKRAADGVAGCQRTWGAGKPRFPMDYHRISYGKHRKNNGLYGSIMEESNIGTGKSPFWTGKSTQFSIATC